MRRVWLLLLAFSAAHPLMAAPVSEQVPVPAAISAIAETLGLPPAAFRASFVAELTRMVYSPTEIGSREVIADLRAHARDPRGAAADAVLVPIPLTTEIWSRAILRRAVQPSDLLTAIISDRRAALVCHGLAGLDDETLSYLADHPAVLTDLYEHVAPEFGAFGSTLHVHDGRVVPPGGEPGRPLWEAVVGATTDRPDRFIHALYAGSEGRIAYLYDTISELDGPHAAFALGTWIDDGAARRDRFQALAAAMVRGYREWPVSARPFVRPQSDFSILMTRLTVGPSGAPAPPASRVFWDGVFDLSTGASPAAAHGLVDAAYLADATGVGDMYVRGDRVEQVSFAQRVFTAPGLESNKDTTLALKAMPRARMLLLALERMGIRKPSVYIAASRAAQEATGGDPNRAFWVLAQLQGSLAVIARLRIAGTIDTNAAERLVVSLSAVPLDAGKYDGGIARWFDRDLVPVLPVADTIEERLTLGLSGHVNDPSAPRIVWEGQQYRLDFGAANARRLRLVMQKQGGRSMDAALGLARLAGRASATPKPGDPHATAKLLASLAESFPPRTKNALPDTMAPGVSAPPPPRERIDRVLADLERMDEVREPDRAARATQPLVETADTVLAEALLALAYAVDIGDPDGTALLASNIAMRHDFGFMLHEGETRARRPWDVPRQDFLPDVPWHVTGSLLGLDIALAPLSLKHIDLENLATAPRLRSTEREAFALNAALLDASRLNESDRTALVAAVERGRTRVAALPQNAADVDPVAAAVRMDGWRRRTLKWTIEHEPARVPGTFSLVELMTLGGDVPAASLDAWGLSAYLWTGCICTRMPAPGGWRLFEGRPQLAYMSFIVSDLNLRIAALLDELHLPAALERPVLADAIQDLIDETSPADANDWLSIAQTAQALTRLRVEDYVAAQAAVDGPLVPVEESATARIP